MKDTRGLVQGRLPKPQLTRPRWRMCFSHHSLELRGPFLSNEFSIRGYVHIIHFG